MAGGPASTRSLARVIVVQPTGHGFDNRGARDALVRLGAGAPDNALPLDRALRRIGGEAACRSILVGNPAKRYGFRALPPPPGSGASRALFVPSLRWCREARAAQSWRCHFRS